MNQYRLVGTTPMLMHNVQLAVPTNKYAKLMKEISGKRGKTEEDLEELAHIEFLGGLYLNDKGEPALPREMLYGVLVRGARKSKNGKLIEAGVTFDQAYYPLTYDGPRTAAALWEFENGSGREFVDQRMVIVNGGRVVRTRPIFREWSVTVTAHVAPEVTEDSVVRQAWRDAGIYSRMGDGRFLGYGAFTLAE